MKGTIFKDGIEYGLFIDGESWAQGDKVNGQLKLKNHGEKSLNISNVKVGLALGKFKKIKSKDSKAFEIVNQKTFDEGAKLPAKGEAELDWEFGLSQNCPITDKTGSLYVLYGANEDDLENGHLQLNVIPKNVFLQYFDIFEKFFRFKVKDYKSKRDAIEAKLVPPKSKEFSNLIGLNIVIKEVNEKMIIIEKKKVAETLNTAGEKP